MQHKEKRLLNNNNNKVTNLECGELFLMCAQREDRICSECKMVIEGKCLRVSALMNKVYHPHHFTCKRCRRELGTDPFFIMDGNPFCQACTPNLFTVTQAGLESNGGSHIGGGGAANSQQGVATGRPGSPSTEALGSQQVCFRCRKEVVDGQFFVFEGKAMCSPCYSGKQLLKSQSVPTIFVAQGADARSMMMLNHSINPHPSSSPPSIDGSTTLIHPRSNSTTGASNNSSRIVGAKSCARCKELISDSRCMFALDCFWHKSCFVCTDCLCPIQGHLFFVKNAQPYCPLHKWCVTPPPQGGANL